MNAHLTEQQLNAYLHQTLTDAQRETLDAHLVSCPACRARRDEMAVLQQRLQRELAAELKTVNVPLSLTFERIAPRLQPPARVTRLWHYSCQALLGMTAIAAALVIIVVIANTSSPAADLSGRHLISNTGRVGNWIIDSDDPSSYEFGVDQSVSHTGQASGFIRSTVDASKGSGSLMQQTAADSYRGKQIRLSAYLKTEGVERQAGLWLRIDQSQIRTLSFADMNDRPIQGTTDWQRYELVLDVPNEATSISFAFFLMGRGQVWADDVQLEAVGQEVATTETKADSSLAQPTNLDFETGLDGWLPERNPQNYTTSIDTVTVHGGQASAHIQSKQANPISSAVLVQNVKADAYRGKRLRVTAYLKFEQVDATVQFVAGTFDFQNTKQVDLTERIYSTPLWQKQSLVFDVPEDSDHIAFGVILQGEGQVWMDDVQVEVVGTDVATSLPEIPPSTIVGQDLDKSFAGWNIAGSRPQDYEMGFDDNVAHSGRSSAYVKSIVPDAPGFGTFATTMSVNEYRGKRIRLSGYVKADQVEDWAGLWMRVDGPEPSTLKYGDTYNVLSFDNMYHRPIQGTQGWQKYEVVLDVPEESELIAYGILLNGKGQVWLDDVQVEVVDTNVALTGAGPLTGADLDQSFSGWSKEGSRPQDYEMGFDDNVAHSGQSSASVKSIAPTAPGFGTFMTTVDAGHYRSKRVRLAGYVKAEQVENMAGLWLRVDGPNSTLLRFDNMQNRPIQGTHDWQEYDVVLDVPENSVQIAYGILLSGKGQVWLDDVQLAEVDQSVPTTDYESKPLTDLGFEIEDHSWAAPNADTTPAPVPPTETTKVETPIARFGNVATLISSMPSNTRFKPGDTLTLDLTWDISQADGYTSFVQVLNAQDQVVAQADLLFAAIKAKNISGQPGTPYLIGQSKIQLPADLPEGEYNLAVGVYNSQTGERLSNAFGQPVTIIGTLEVRPDLTVTIDTKHVHVVHSPTGYFPSIESHFEIAIRNACQDLGCEVDATPCAQGGTDYQCSPYTSTLTVTVYVDPKATALYGWMSEDQLMFKVPLPSSSQGSPSVFDVPDSLALLVEKVARSVYGWPPQSVSGLPIFHGIVDWETYQLDQRLGGARLADPFQPDQIAGTTLPPLESLWVSGPIVSETREMQSEAAVLIAFVEKEFGAPAVGKLLKAVGHADSLPDAIESGLNLKYTDFEQRWHDWLKSYNAN